MKKKTAIDILGDRKFLSLSPLEEMDDKKEGKEIGIKRERNRSDRLLFSLEAKSFSLSLWES